MKQTRRGSRLEFGGEGLTKSARCPAWERARFLSLSGGTLVGVTFVLAKNLQNTVMGRADRYFAKHREDQRFLVLVMALVSLLPKIAPLDFLSIRDKGPTRQEAACGAWRWCKSARDRSRGHPERHHSTPISMMGRFRCF